MSAESIGQRHVSYTISRDHPAWHPGRVEDCPRCCYGDTRDLSCLYLPAPPTPAQTTAPREIVVCPRCKGPVRISTRDGQRWATCVGANGRAACYWSGPAAPAPAAASTDPAPPDATDEPTRHDLKTWPEAFQAMWDGWKTFEVRKDDRHYVVGDCLHLREWVPSLSPRHERYTGRWINALVTYKVPGGRWGIPNDLCVLAIRETKRGAASTDTEVTK